MSIALPLPKRNRTAGFTLIEMLISIGLLALLIGGAIAGYRKFNDRQAVIQAAKEVVSTLRLAQKRASVGDKPDVAGCNGGEKLDGYRVRGSINTGTYTMAPVCDGNEALAAQQTYDLRNDAVFRQAVDIRFLMLSRGVQFGAGGDSVTFEVGQQVAPGYKYTIQVSKSGEMYEPGLETL